MSDLTTLSISGRCYREPWPKMMAFVNWLFSWQKNHCKSAYDNDLKWAKSYIEQDKEVSSRTEPTIMPDKKISQLPAVTTPLEGTETLPIMQSGTTKNVTALDD